MGVIEGGEVVSSGDEGGGTCHNDKPGQSKDKVIQKGGDAGRVKKGGAGGTCHNDKPGRNDGYGGSRYDGGGGEGGSRWMGETCNRSKPRHVPEEMETR